MERYAYARGHWYGLLAKHKHAQRMSALQDASHGNVHANQSVKIQNTAHNRYLPGNGTCQRAILIEHAWPCCHNKNMDELNEN